MLTFFPRGVLDEMLNLIESVSEEFPSYSYSLIVLKTLSSFTEGCGKLVRTIKIVLVSNSVIFNS